PGAADSSSKFSHSLTTCPCDQSKREQPPDNRSPPNVSQIDFRTQFQVLTRQASPGSGRHPESLRRGPMVCPWAGVTVLRQTHPPERANELRRSSSFRSRKPSQALKSCLNIREPSPEAVGPPHQYICESAPGWVLLIFDRPATKNSLASRVSDV